MPVHQQYVTFHNAEVSVALTKGMFGIPGSKMTPSQKGNFGTTDEILTTSFAQERGRSFLISQVTYGAAAGAGTSLP